MLRAIAGGGGSGGGASTGTTTTIAPTIAATRDNWGTCGGTGILNGTATEGGGTWQLSGEGFDTAIRNPGGFATCPLNTYCFIEAGAPVVRGSSEFEGPEATVALCVDTSLNDMIHVNFTKGDNPFVMFWKTGVGPSQFPTYERFYQTIPTTPGKMRFDVEFRGGFIYSYAEGKLCSVHWDANLVVFPELKFVFGQLHAGAPDKLYNVMSYVGPRML